MTIRSIISKTLNTTEKTLLRKKKLKHTSLSKLKIGQIAELLKVNKQRASVIFKAIHAKENSEKSVSAVDQANDSDDTALIQDDSYIQNLGIGIAASMNKSFDYLDTLRTIPASTAYIMPTPAIDAIYRPGSVVANALANHDHLLNGINFPKLDVLGKSAVTAGVLQGPAYTMLSAQTNPQNLLTSAHHPVFDWQKEISASVMPAQQLLASITSPLAGAEFSISAVNKFTAAITPEILGMGANTSILAATNVLNGVGEFSQLGSIAVDPRWKDSFLVTSPYSTLGIGTISAGLTKSYAGSGLFDPKISAALSNVSMVNTLAEASLANVQWLGFGKEYKVTAALLSAAKHDFIDFTTDYRDVLKSIDAKPNWVYEVPKLVELPSQSFYTQSRMVEMMSIAEFETSTADIELEEENSSRIEELLHRLDPDMIKMWEGAVYALKGENPDYLRHFTVSIRELYTHLTHALSPDKEFKKWDQTGEFLHEGKPTREGRLYYINRNLHGSKKEVSKFLEGEVKNTIELMVMLNGGTHGINSRLTKPQLKVIKIKAEQIFVSLLQIEFSINRVN